VAFVNEFQTAKESPLGKGSLSIQSTPAAPPKSHKIWDFVTSAESAFGNYQQNETRSPRLNTGKIRGLCSCGVPVKSGTLRHAPSGPFAFTQVQTSVQYKSGSMVVYLRNNGLRAIREKNLPACPFVTAHA
jgi:hypothetical protein